MLAAFVLCVVMGQQEAFQAFQEARRNQAESDEAWRTAKKLSLTDNIPSEPRQSLEINNLNTGDIGYLEQWQLSIFDIVGERDMLLAMRNPEVPPIWLEDYPTKNLADGDKVRIIGLVEFTGTKSVGGRTVRVAELVTPARESEIKKEMEKKRDSALTRKWTDSTGQHTTVGKFLEFKSDRVSIERKPDGKLLSVPMSKLSKDDQKWIRDELKKRLAEKKPAKQESVPKAFE